MFVPLLHACTIKDRPNSNSMQLYYCIYIFVKASEKSFRIIISLNHPRSHVISCMQVYKLIGSTYNQINRLKANYNAIYTHIHVHACTHIYIHACTGHAAPDCDIQLYDHDYT